MKDDDVDCIAVCDLDEAKAHQTAGAFGIKHCYSDAAEMIREQRPDVLDVVTSPSTHRQMVELAASTKTPVICQKPMTNDFAEAKEMVQLSGSPDSLLCPRELAMAATDSGVEENPRFHKHRPPFPRPD